MPQQTIDDLLTRLRARQRWLNISDGALRGLSYGGMAGLILAVTIIVSGLAWPGGSPWWIAIAIPIGGLSGMIAGLLRPIHALSLARALDRASQSQDRFASALQLADHPRQQRVRLIAENALKSVESTSVNGALPVRWSREVKWFPVLAIALGGLLAFAPSRQVVASQDAPPEVTSEQWQQLSDQLDADIARRFDQPNNEKEKEIAAELNRLAEVLKQEPDKKEALGQIAALRAQLNQRRDALGTRELHLRKAAAAIENSETLKQLAERLKKRDLKGSSAELKRLAELLRLRKLNPDADELQAIGKDLERLAKALKSLEKLSKETELASQAARELNLDELAEALERMAELIELDLEKLEEADALCEACESLDELERMLARLSNGKCPHCGNKKCIGCNGGNRFVRTPSRRKGGLEAGRGTVKEWKGGALSETETKVLPVMDNPHEGQGPVTTVTQTLSTDEDAESALSYEEKLTEMVEQAEADLELEDVPPAYREYMRRYFSSIKPKSADEGEEE